MSGRGGKREGAGRPKGAKNKENRILEQILEDEKANLVAVAIKMAKKGNTAVLCKLLDKVAPSLTDNKNLNLTDTIEDLVLRNYPTQNTDNKADTAKPEEENSENELKTQEKGSS